MMPKVELPHGVVIDVNEKEWINQETVIKQMDKIWRKGKGYL